MMSRQYILFDAARCGMSAIEQAEAICGGESISLYARDGANGYLADIGPHLLQADDVLMKWYVENGHGNAWGMIIQTKAALSDCLEHFRQFLFKKENGSRLFFRFYDPRVLKVFLPTCKANQLTDFFGPVEAFITESDNPDKAIQFRVEQGILKKQEIALPATASPAIIVNS
jgi:hypothetical protein